MSPGARHVLVAAVLFGTTGTAQALGPDGADPLAVGALRLLVGSAGLIAVARIRPLRTLQRSGWWSVLAVAGVAGYQLAFFGGVREAGVAVGTLVTIGSAPALTGIVSRVTGGPAPSRQWYIATAVAVVGLTLIAGVDGSAPIGGVALALGAGLSYACFSVGSRRLIEDVGSVPAMAAVFTAGSALLLPLLFTRDISFVAEPAGLGAILWLGLVATTTAYVFYGAGLAEIDATEVATLVLAEPVTATLLAVVVLGERLGVGAAIGIGLVVAGLTLLARSTSRPPAVTG